MNAVKKDQAIRVAFIVFANAYMPWFFDELDEDEDEDTNRLMRVTAKIAFQHGYEAALAANKGDTQ